MYKARSGCRYTGITLCRPRNPDSVPTSATEACCDCKVYLYTAGSAPCRRVDTGRHGSLQPDAIPIRLRELAHALLHQQRKAETHSHIAPSLAANHNAKSRRSLFHHATLIPPLGQTRTAQHRPASSRPSSPPAASSCGDACADGQTHAHTASSRAGVRRGVRALRWRRCDGGRGGDRADRKWRRCVFSQNRRRRRRHPWAGEALAAGSVAPTHPKPRPVAGLAGAPQPLPSGE